MTSVDAVQQQIAAVAVAVEAAKIQRVDEALDSTQVPATGSKQGF